MKQKKHRGEYLCVLMGLLSLLTIWGCSDKKQATTLSPDEFISQVNKCEKSGGNPIPIYDKLEPIKVYRIDCKR